MWRRIGRLQQGESMRIEEVRICQTKTICVNLDPDLAAIGPRDENYH